MTAFVLIHFLFLVDLSLSLSLPPSKILILMKFCHVYLDDDPFSFSPAQHLMGSLLWDLFFYHYFPYALPSIPGSIHHVLIFIS